RARGRRFVLLLVLVGFLVVVILSGLRRQRWRGATVERRFPAVEQGRPWRRAAGNQPPVGQRQHPPQPRFRAHRGMKRPAQRDRAIVIRFHERRVIVFDRRQLIFLRPRAEAA